MKRILLILMGIILLSLTGFSATVTSIQTGNWSDGAIWDSGTVPTSSDDVVIDVGHIVTIDASQDCHKITINATDASNYGELKIISNGVLTTSISSEIFGSLLINNGAFYAGSKLTINGSKGGAGTITISGGTLDLTTYFALKSGATFVMTDGLVIVCTGGPRNTNTNLFEVPDGTFFTMSGGEINFHNNNIGSGVDLKFNPLVSNITNGNIVFLENGNDYTMIADENLYNITSVVGAGHYLTIKNMPGSLDGFECNSLIASSGHIIIENTCRIKINNTLSLENGAVPNNSGLTIKSSSSSTGSMVVNSMNSSGLPLTIERFVGAWVDNAHGWHYLSSPVLNQKISPEFVDITATPISNHLDFYRWSEPDLLWINIKNNNGNYNQGSSSINFSNDPDPEFELAKGYLIAYEGDSVKEFHGCLRTSSVNVTGLTYTNANSGWHLLGNPFSSSLSWDKTNWNRVNIDAYAKIWNADGAAWVDLGSSETIPNMQGFMVHVNNVAGGSLTIDKDDRTNSSLNWYKEDSIVTNRIKLTVYDTEGNTAQESIIRIDENATAGFDSEFDSHFLAGYAPQFYSITEDGIKVSTNGLPDLTESTVIPFSFIKNSSSTYYIQAVGINELSPNQTVYLNDLKTNYTQKLNESPIYHFTSEEGDLEERFELYFGPLGIDNNIQDENSIHVFAKNENIEIRSKTPLKATVNIYNISGQLVLQSTINNESSASINTRGLKGIIIVSVIDNKQVFNHKVILR